MSNKDFEFKIERGWHSTVIIYPHLGIVIKVFKEGLAKNAEKEYNFLNILYRKGLNVPKPYALIIDKKKPIIIREYIDGLHLREFLNYATIDELRNVLYHLINLIYNLDLEQVFLDELSRATKNIIISKSLKPYIIDFERATLSKRSNVTQFLSYLYKLAISDSPVSLKIKKILDLSKLSEASAHYKKHKDFKVILECFKE